MFSSSWRVFAQALATVAAALPASGLAASAPAASPPAATGRDIAARAASAPPAEAQNTASAQAKKVLGKLVNAIRYERDNKAAEQLAFGPLAQRLLGDSWSKLSADEQVEVVAGLEKIIRRESFVRGREVFKYLNAIRFEPAQKQGELTHVRSTVVIFRDLKKSELVIDWLMVDTPQGPKVVDTVMLGESTADAIRDEQIKPLLAEGGVPALLGALRKKVSEVGG